jgi:hypothetical protein
MLARLVFGALLMGTAALGWPAALATQQPVALPLRDARALVVVDAWTGYSPIAPIHATYSLVRSVDGAFTGTAQIHAGAGLLRRDTSFAVHLPRSAVDSLLEALSKAPLQEGRYRPTFTHTDDYPTITVDLTVGDSVIRFRTTSQGAAHVPWSVSAGGRRYVSASEVIWPALDTVLVRIGGREQAALIEAVQSDPEARCRRSPYSASLPQRPRYAGNETWFAQDSSITVQGRSYRKYGLPRIVGINEITPYATYRGVPMFQEEGPNGTPEVLYAPVGASCEVQPYLVER